MTRYFLIGFLALWVIGMIIAFVIGIYGDVKNSKDDSILDIRNIKKQFILAGMEIIFGIIFLIKEKAYRYVAVLYLVSGVTMLIFAFSQLHKRKKKDKQDCDTNKIEQKG
ncbi:MAG: hypothetical protein J6X78_11600 [Treponema sp.]|nr:hypothetical protein [Treponema sp.]